MKKNKIITLCNPKFYYKIIDKYSLFRKSGKLPALIFLKLFGTGIMNKVTNIYRTELINNHFRLHLNFYLSMISQLNQILSHYYQSKKHPYSADYSEIKLWPGARISSFYSPELSDSFSNVIERRSRSPKRSEWVIPRFKEIADDYDAPSIIPSKRIVPFMQPLTQSLQNLQDITMTNGTIKQSPTSPSILYMDSRFLHHNVFAHVRHIQILKPYKPRLIKMSFPRKWESTRDIKNWIPAGVYPALRCGAGMTGREPFSYEGNKLRKKDVYNIATENVYFHNQRKIEQEVEEIKKVVIETKETVEEKSLSAHSLKGDMDKYMKQHLDINSLSDQVYQNIERRIRVERERRGL